MLSSIKMLSLQLCLKELLWWNQWTMTSGCVRRNKSSVPSSSVLYLLRSRNCCSWMAAIVANGEVKDWMKWRERNEKSKYCEHQWRDLGNSKHSSSGWSYLPTSWLARSPKLIARRYVLLVVFNFFERNTPRFHRQTFLLRALISSLACKRLLRIVHRKNCDGGGEYAFERSGGAWRTVHGRCRVLRRRVKRGVRDVDTYRRFRIQW